MQALERKFGMFSVDAKNIIVFCRRDDEEEESKFFRIIDLLLLDAAAGFVMMIDRFSKSVLLRLGAL